MRPLSLSKKVVIPAVAAVAATGAIAVAAIPSANGTINGCFTTGGLNKGNLRIVDEGVACRTGETAIAWNQKGVKGDKGELGAAGPAGAAGPVGPAGAVGAAGAKGDPGAAGAKGEKGDPGAAGAAGLDGAAGAAGLPGRDGRDGKDGAQGATGPKGDTGAAGPAGPQGPAGPAGPSGAAAALVLGGEALQGGTADAFLKLEKPVTGGFPNSFGESTVKGHEGEIELNSFNFSVENLISIGSSSGGAGAGKAKFGTFHFTKFFDSATPSLLKAASTGIHFPTATVTFRKRGVEGAAADFLKVRFKLAFVSKWEQGGKAEPPLLENIDFTVGAFAVEYRQQNPNGSLGDPKTFGWDVTRNTEDEF